MRSRCSAFVSSSKDKKEAGRLRALPRTAGRDPGTNRPNRLVRYITPAVENARPAYERPARHRRTRTPGRILLKAEAGQTWLHLKPPVERRSPVLHLGGDRGPGADQAHGPLWITGLAPLPALPEAPHHQPPKGVPASGPERHRRRAADGLPLAGERPSNASFDDYVRFDLCYVEKTAPSGSTSPSSSRLFPGCCPKTAPLTGGRHVNDVALGQPRSGEELPQLRRLCSPSNSCPTFLRPAVPR